MRKLVELPLDFHVSKWERLFLALRIQFVRKDLQGLCKQLDTTNLSIARDREIKIIVILNIFFFREKLIFIQMKAGHR